MEKAVLEGHFVIIEHLIVGGAEGGAGMLHKITKPTASRGDSEVLEDVFHHAHIIAGSSGEEDGAGTPMTVDHMLRAARSRDCWSAPKDALLLLERRLCQTC